MMDAMEDRERQRLNLELLLRKLHGFRDTFKKIQNR